MSVLRDRTDDPGPRRRGGKGVGGVVVAVVVADGELGPLEEGGALRGCRPTRVGLGDSKGYGVIHWLRRPHRIQRVDAGVDLALDGADLVAAHDGAEPVGRVDGLPHEVLRGGVSPEEADVGVHGVAVLVLAGGDLRVGRVGHDDVALLREAGGEQLLLGVEGVADDVVRDRDVVPCPERPPPVGAVGEGAVGVAARGGEHVGNEARALHAGGGEAGAVGVGPPAGAAERRGLEPLVGRAEVVGVALVGLELRHDLLARDADDVREVLGAARVVQVVEGGGLRLGAGGVRRLRREGRTEQAEHLAQREEE